MSLSEPSHIGVFPLQFSAPTKSEEQLASLAQYGYEEKPKHKRQGDRTKRVTMRETEGREGREGRDGREQALCECRNCQLERKYERKRRKKSERVTWS